MEIIKTENLSFSYNGIKALDNINLSVNEGEFITICGKSGSGKTTLLKMIKPTLTPYGKRKGDINFCNKPLREKQDIEIGFIMQNPKEQIVTDKVWHELAFGLESLGVETLEIRRRVAEMASFFGIEEWFHKKTADLSGGETQLLNLAAVMVMNPRVLLLDEPTSQLDPVWAEKFLEMIKRINREMGTTVILTEHRLHSAFTISDRVIVMEKGEIIADEKPEGIGSKIKGNAMYLSLPPTVRLYGELEGGKISPVTIKDAKLWFNEYLKDHTCTQNQNNKGTQKKEAIIELKNVWFRYEKESPDIIKGLDLKINKGEIHSIIGGNGTGKSTLLSLITSINAPYRGRVLVKGDYGFVPQDPEMLFLRSTVREDLGDNADVAKLFNLKDVLHRHPYDLSGGEKQRVALAKVILKDCDIILLDEPTKGMDAHFKKEFGEILKNLKRMGKTIVMVSHDIEFCAEFADKTSYMFDGIIVSEGTPREMFSKNTFYTTQTNKIVRDVLPDAILVEDVIEALKGEKL